MKHITSLDNPEIKQLVKLRTKKGRSLQQRYLAEGIRACSTLIKKHTLLHLYVTELTLAHASELIPASTITIVSEAVMQKISTTTTPSGIIGVFQLPLSPDFSHLTAGLVLAHITDPGNMGTLIRSAAAMNARSVVIINGVDPFSPKVVQASAGSCAYINLFQCSWSELLQHKKSLSLCALVPRGGRSPEELDLRTSLLVVGNEAHGIDPTWIADCQQQLTLTMPGDTESLNAAVAGSIALYYATQQRLL